jgi:DnaK suppressor protein
MRFSFARTQWPRHTSNELEAILNTRKYKQQLLDEEKRLLDGLEHAGTAAREAGNDTTGDVVDRTVSGEQKENEFQEATMDWEILRQVRDALRRIEEGTYGKCVVDNEPIEEKRLDAMPWTPYCMKHQQLLEGAHPPPMPTL